MIDHASLGKKLKLDSETLRVLDSGDLAGAQGGGTGDLFRSISLSVTGNGCAKCCDCNHD